MSLKYFIINIAHLQTIAYHDRRSSKWFRAVVDHIYDDSSYILWLTDYGYAVHAYKNQVQRLKNRFHEPETFGNVLKVGVANVVPASIEYDFIKLTTRMEVEEKWNEKVVVNVKRLLEDATVIKFEKKLRTNDHVFGKILIETSDGTVVDLAHSLSHSPFAVKSKGTSDFSKELKRVQTVDIKRYEHIFDQNNSKPETSIVEKKIPKAKNEEKLRMVNK